MAACRYVHLGVPQCFSYHRVLQLRLTEFEAKPTFLTSQNSIQGDSSSLSSAEAYTFACTTIPKERPRELQATGMGESKAGKGLGTNREERQLRPGSWRHRSTKVLSAMETHSRRPPTGEQLLCHNSLPLHCSTAAAAAESAQLKARRGAATHQGRQSCSPCSSSASQAGVLEHEIKPHLTRSLKVFKK